MRYPDSELAVSKAYEVFIRVKPLQCSVPTVGIYNTEQLRELHEAHAREHGEEPPSSYLMPNECYLAETYTVALRHRRPYGGRKEIPTIVGINPKTAIHELYHHVQACRLGAKEYIDECGAEIERILKQREAIRLEYDERFKVSPREAGEWVVRQRVRDIRFELEAERFARENWSTFYEIIREAEGLV